MEDKNVTDIWKKYEKCKAYADKKAIVSKTEKNWNFFLGNQWEGAKTGGEDLPLLNFIKPVIQYKVSVVAQNSMVAMYSDINGNPKYSEVYKKLNEFWAQCWEKSKMDAFCWKALKSASIQGDSYMYWKDGNTLEPPQIIGNTSIFFADENIDNLQDQAFIIIEERWGLDEIKKLAEENGISDEDIQSIKTDNETQNQIVNKSEVEDKVKVLFYLERKDGIIHTGRSTQTVVIEPVEAIEGERNGKKLKGLSVYPIANLVWENVPNSMRGQSEVEQMIPNQLELNKTLARRSMAVKIGAFPRLAYDVNAIENPEDLDKVGVAIAVQGGNAQSIQQMISYLNATNISSDADKLSDDLLRITKELAGASDFAMGNVNPEYASGQAIIAVRDQTQIPLNEQVAKYTQFVEDISILWVDLWIAYNPNGLEWEEDVDGELVQMQISHKELVDLKPTVNIDVSPDNRWTKLAEQNSLDNLLENGHITLEEYVEVTPDHSSIPKAKLRAILKKRQEQATEVPQEEETPLEPQLEPQMAQEMPQEPPIDINTVLQSLTAKGVPEQDALKLIQDLNQ